MNEDKLKSFKDEIEKVCKDYGISISHEDNQGAFLFIEYNENHMEWFKDGEWEYCPKNLKMGEE